MTQFPGRSDLSPRAPKWALPPSQVEESERSFDANAFKTSIALAFACSSEGTALADAFAESKHAARVLFYNCTFMCTTLIHVAHGWIHARLFFLDNHTLRTSSFHTVWAPLRFQISSDFFCSLTSPGLPALPSLAHPIALGPSSTHSHGHLLEALVRPLCAMCFLIP